MSPHSDLLALPLTEPDLTYAVGLVFSDREPPAPLAKALSAVAAEDGLAKRIRTTTSEALAPWRL